MSNYTIKTVCPCQNETSCECAEQPSWAKGKLFLKEILGLTGMEVSVNHMEVGQEVPFYHQHKHNEELYLFLRGEGEMMLDGEVHPVNKGSAVRVAPDCVRTWRNVGNEALCYIVIQAPEGKLETWTGTDGIRLEKAVVWPES